MSAENKAHQWDDGVCEACGCVMGSTEAHRPCKPTKVETVLRKPEPPSEHVESPRQNELSLFIQAAKRLSDGTGYIHWTFGGGPNQCEHGFAEGVPCRECDRETIKDFDGTEFTKPLSDDVKAVKEEVKWKPCNHCGKGKIFPDTHYCQLCNKLVYYDQISGLKEPSEHSAHVLQNALKAIQRRLSQPVAWYCRYTRKDARYWWLTDFTKRQVEGNMAACVQIADEAIIAAPVTPKSEVPTIDLEVSSWEQIKQAAKESPWIPPEYFQNDWVSDVCAFLREPASVSSPAGSSTASGSNKDTMRVDWLNLLCANFSNWTDFWDKFVCHHMADNIREHIDAAMAASGYTGKKDA